MTQRFTDKVVLVTGGGSGIGRATALAFAEEGATVVVAGRKDSALRETVCAIESSGGRASAVTADVVDEGQVERMVATAVHRHGGLDIAFNNAGAMTLGKLADLTEDAWRGSLSVATGTWLSMKYEIAYMRNNGGGAIVNMSSIIGPHWTLPGAGAYAATKAAISSLTRTAALENIKDGIRINAISPGAIATPFSLRPGESEREQADRVSRDLPIGRVGSLAEVAGTVLWLASAESGFAVGADVVIDGGASI